MSHGKGQTEKVAIFYVPIGTGHEMAALAVEQALAPLLATDNCRVSMLDACQLCDKSVFTGGRGVHESLNTITGQLYDFLWRSELFAPAEDKFGKFLALVSKGLEDYLLNVRPRLVISTHAMPSILVSYFRRKHRLDNLEHLAVTTDFRAHSCWPVSGVDLYAVASEEAGRDLVGRGVPSQVIKVTGIPLRSGFTRARKSRRPLPVVLVVAGSSQRGLYSLVVKKLWPALQKFDDNSGFELSIVTGRDTRLKESLERHVTQRQLQNIKVFGFVEEMGELMAVADLLVTKPGGLICSEALAVGLPLLLVGPNFGQEKANAEYLTRKGAAVRVGVNEDVLSKINEVLQEKELLLEMAKSALGLSKPRAAQDVAKLAKQLLSSLPEIDCGQE